MPAETVAAATVASTTGTAMLMYLLLCRRFPAEEERAGGGGDVSKTRVPGRVTRRIARGSARAPNTWQEEVAATVSTLGFMMSELLGKWPIMDLVFGIKYLMRRRGNLQVASVYAGSNCVQLKGHAIMAKLVHLLRLLNLCMFFSKKPFRVFLKSTGYFREDVLLRVPKAGILKPSFTILCDKSSNCFLLLIRGMHSMKDMLTALNGAVVPFHHSVLHEGGVSKSVLGYAHCGMAAAAHWISKCATPCLLEAVSKYPDYNIKVIGNSLGGGTAALLTYILREREEFSSSTCVAFAPAACMTWDLAESGKHFITTIINGSDQVPTCSITSVDNLRSEVTSSSWLKDLWTRCTRFLCAVNCFTSLGSDLPCGGARALSRRMSSQTQAVDAMSQSSMGVRRRAVGMVASPKVENTPGHCTMSVKDSVSLVIERVNTGIQVDGPDSGCSSGSDHGESEIGELIRMYRVTTVSTAEEYLSDGEWRFELVKKLHNGNAPEEQAAAAVKEIAGEGNVARREAAVDTKSTSSDAMETLKFYPPGRIMHMVAGPASDSNRDENVLGDESIGIYETPRDLYSKIRLSRRMIKDHYMPMYKKTMELLIDKLGKDDDDCCTSILL